jgi:hypothetical protein
MQPSYAELLALPVLAAGPTMDLKYCDSQVRIWVSRTESLRFPGNYAYVREYMRAGCWEHAIQGHPLSTH